QTGDIIHRIKGLPGIIKDLEFSPDGRWLAAGLSGNNGVRIFDTGGWGETKKLEEYESDVYNIAFKPGGGLATVSYDGNIRLYNNRFELIKHHSYPPNHEIYSLAFNPSGNLLAIGYSDIAETTEIEVRDGSNLSLLFKPSIAEMVNGTLNKLSFSADGSRLYGAGSFSKIRFRKQLDDCCSLLNNAGKGNYTDL
ncbi:MAG: WD40 repeat domain-containing protein, partial [Chitinophagaceae bacterium]|nr:WD40 repeat domain-containing protein [Chitinophagaceae bacterium]